MAGALTNLMILVRPGTDYRQLSQDIGSALRELDPDYPLDIHLFNNIQENLYQKELLLGKQILFFSLIAVFVSLVGVFGVVLFESEYKRKQIITIHRYDRLCFRNKSITVAPNTFRMGTYLCG